MRCALILVCLKLLVIMMIVRLAVMVILLMNRLSIFHVLCILLVLRRSMTMFNGYESNGTLDKSVMSRN